MGLAGVIYVSLNFPAGGLGNHLPGGAMIAVMLIALTYNVVAKLLRLRPFNATELTVIFGMGLGVSVLQFSHYFPGQVAGPAYLASPENRWAELVLPYYPDHLVIKNEAVTKSLYEGLAPGQALPWGAWLGPTAWWLLFAYMLYFPQICMSTLLRRRWVEEGHFTFPLMQVPAEMVEAPAGRHLLNSLYRNPLLWIGVAIPVFVHGLSGLHVFYPVVPGIPKGLMLDAALIARPWNELVPFNLYVQASAVGFAYLLPLELSASFWFFFLFYKAQCLVGGMLGCGVGFALSIVMWLALGGWGPPWLLPAMFGGTATGGGMFSLSKRERSIPHRMPECVICGFVWVTPTGPSCPKCGAKKAFASWVGRVQVPVPCTDCGYDLTGNESGVCPECGTRIESPTSEEAGHPNRRG